MAFKSKATKKRSADAMDSVTPNGNIQKSALPNSLPPTTVQSPAPPVSFTEWLDRSKKSKTMDFQFSKNMDCRFSKFEAGAPNPFAEPLEKMLATRYHSTIDDLDDLLYDEPLPACPKMGVMEWVEKEYKSARGFELGTIGTSLLQGMWKKQSSKWENLALGFTSDCIVLVHSYIRDLLEGICEDNRVRYGLLSVLMDTLTERYRQALLQTRFVLQVERQVLTTNHYFTDNLEKWWVIPKPDRSSKANSNTVN